MDNNNTPGQPTTEQPIPAEQPAMQQPVQGQPMPEQSVMQQPIQGQPMPQQPMGQPIPQMAPQMVPQQPMMKQPKQPMDPAKKKKIIFGASIGGGVAVVAILLAILLPILLRVDYAPAYKIAKELKPKLYDIYHSYDCDYVLDYVSSTYRTAKEYSEYIEGCKQVFDSGATDLIAQLGNSGGVKRNSEISTQYDKFNAAFATVGAMNTADLNEKLELYKVWHNYVLALDDLDYGKSTDAEFTAAGNILVESGNDTLKTYGESWLERSLELASLYRAYSSMSYGSERTAAYSRYREKYNEMSNWAASNKPDITAVAQLNFNDASAMYSEFTKLYDLISATYAKNYNSGSGDCTEFLGEVYCD